MLLNSFATLFVLLLSTVFAEAHRGPKKPNRKCVNLHNTTPSGHRQRLISLRRGATSAVLDSEQTQYTGCWKTVAGCSASGRSMQASGDAAMQMTFDTSVKAYLVSMDSANGELKLTYPVVNEYAAYALIPPPGAKPAPGAGRCLYQAAVMINTTQITTSGMTWFDSPATPVQPPIGAGAQITDGSPLFRINSVTAFRSEAALRAAVPGYTFVLIMKGVPGDNTKRSVKESE